MEAQSEEASCVTAFQARLQRGVVSHLDQEGSNNWPMVELAIVRSDQIRSVAKLCPTLCDPMNCSTPGFPVLHRLLELAQTHVH